jgi:nitroreductase
MTIRELITKNRSYRRFDEMQKVPMSFLEELIDLARLSASARNAQPLKYILSNNPEMNAKIFDTLAWAGYLQDWDGPVEGERPSAYIIMLGDTEISNNYYCDHGIAAQSILLGATENGFGGCIIASIKHNDLRNFCNIDKKYEILQIIALGKPIETVVIDPLSDDGNIKYWRDYNQVHHVPKRPLTSLVIQKYSV